MLARLAWLLDVVNLRNLCFLYFLVTPLLLDRKDMDQILILFAIGYLLSGGILILAFAERLSRFGERIGYDAFSLLAMAVALAAFTSVLLNTPALLLSGQMFFFKYGKLLFPMLVFFVMVNVWSRRDLPKLARLLLAFGFAAIVVGIYETLAGGGFASLTVRAGSLLFGDANKCAIVLNILYGFLLSELIARRTAGRPYLPFAMVILIVLSGILMTQSRSGILTFMVVTGVVFTASRSWAMIRWGLTLTAPLIVLAAAVFAYRYFQPVNTQLSDLGRVWTYAVAWEAIKDNPLLGVGFGNTGLMYEAYGQQYEMLIGFAMDVHNVILEIFAQQGIFGLIVYLSFIAFPMVVLVRRILAFPADRYPVVEVAALIVPVVFSVYGMVSHQYIANEFFWAYLAFTAIVIREPSARPDEALFSGGPVARGG